MLGNGTAFLNFEMGGGLEREFFISRIHYVMFFVLLIGRVEYIQKKEKMKNKGNKGTCRYQT